MRHRLPLPDQLGDHFTVRDAAAAGIRRGRTAARDLTRPFHGVRAREPLRTPMQRVRALVPRLKPGQLIAGRTALRVWGYPIPGAWSLDDDIDVVVETSASRPRTRGVRGLRLAPGRAEAWRIGAVPIVDPVAALFMCAKTLSDRQTVVVLDAILTTADNYPGLHPGRPVASVNDIRERLREWGRFPGCGRVRSALDAARAGVESPKETETRLLLVAAGFSEPEIQFEIRDGGRLVARTDLAYPRLRIAIEYEGDGHRTGREQWRRDIQRQRDLEDLGWIVIRVTELDLRDGGRHLLRRLRGAIASRTPSPARAIGVHTPPTTDARSKEPLH